MTTITTVLQTRRVSAGRKRLATRNGTAEAKPTGKTPRISRLMALAIKFQGMLCEGVVKDLSELARLARVTQPRMTQIMNLTFLAPDIQEEILFSSQRATDCQLRKLQQIAQPLAWTLQRDAWIAIQAGGRCP